MLKTNAVLEVIKNDRVYSLTLPNNAPLGELHDVLYQMRCFLIEKINEITNVDKPKESLEPLKEEA
jgi:hypothetical protein